MEGSAHDVAGRHAQSRATPGNSPKGTPQNGLFRLISILGRIGHDAAAWAITFGEMRESGACGVVVFCGDYPLSPLRPSSTPIVDTICLKTDSIFATL